MSFEERMEQLGRRAVEQEPAELALPRCVRASESVKPVSCVKFRVQRHGFGEGRLPIPATVIHDKDDRKDAGRQHQQDSCDSPERSARKAGKLLRPSQQQAQQQLDAIKARRSAAKAFSEALDRRNAGLLQSSSNSSKAPSTAAAPGSAGRDDEPRPATPPHASRRASSHSQQPLVERHIPARASSGPNNDTAAAAAAAAPASAAAGVQHTAPDAAAAAAAMQEQPTPALTGYECGSEPSLCLSSLAAAAAAADDGNSSGSAGMVDSAAATCEAAAGTSAAAAAGADSAFGRCVSSGRHTGSLGHTFLMQPGSQPASPMHQAPWRVSPAMACTTADALSDAADLDGGAEAPLPAAAAAASVCEAGAGAVRAATPELEEYVAYVASAAAAANQDNSAPAAGLCSSPEAAHSSDAHTAFGSSTDATSRLLSYAHGGLGRHAQHPNPQPAAAAAAAAAVARLAPGRCSSETAAPSTAGSPVARGGSPTGRRPQAAAGPHWSPVPPPTQLQPPLVVRPMDNWVQEPQHLQQTATLTSLPQQPRQAQPLQQQQGASQHGCRPPWVGPRDRPAGSTAAARGDGACTGGGGNAVLPASRRVSAAGGHVQSESSRAGGVTRGAGGSSGCGVAAAAFSSPELVQLVAAAADKVAKRRLVLPALCSCGHGTPVLDARYPMQCCSNCPMRDGAVYESLLTGLLAGMGLD